MWIVLGLLVLLGLLYVIVAYNSLVTLRLRVKNAWAQVDVQLKRRYDLIPNLVATVKKYAEHEQETFRHVTEARAKAMQAATTDGQAGAETELTASLRTLFAVAENYPELKADANFRQLQQELSDTESKIAFARQFYNDTVQKYNTRRQIFPVNLIAGSFGFKEEKFFTLDLQAEEREAVVVDFTEKKK
ncbi:MAG TPA: LemA family protein [Firmicutes bacterium]|nr:LemA family protein [Bacillota bacterium]